MSNTIHNKRLVKDFNDLIKLISETPNNYYSIFTNNEISINKTNFTIILKRPNDTSYSEKYFNLNFKVPSEYPFKPPLITFLTKINHPNVDKHGNICLDILLKQWSPVLSFSKIVILIYSLLSDPYINTDVETNIN
jgi:ubiquitin-conjugating enzyme E2 D/E